MASQINTDNFTVENLRPLVASFAQQIRPKQWEMLLKGEPDVPTKTLLAEAMLEITDTCAKSILASLEAAQLQVTEEAVSAAIADTLPQSFAEGLKQQGKDQLSSDSAEWLKSLMVKEVLERVKSSSSSENSPQAAPRVTPPNRVDEMVDAAVAMIRGSMETPAGTSRRSGSRTSSVDDEETFKGLESLRSDLSSPRSTDSAGTASKKVVRSIIQRALKEMTEPLTDTLMPDTYEEMESRISEETEEISAHISSFIEPQQATEQSAEKLTPKALVGKVKAFFARQFAKVSLFRICGKFQKKSDKVLETESRESVQAIEEAVDSLLDIQENAEDGEEVCYLRIPEGKTLNFTEALTDLIYERSTEVVPPQLRSSDALYVDIQHGVVLFLSLLRWWLTTQMEPHSRQVLRAVTESKQPLPCSDVEVLAPWVEAPLTPETVVNRPETLVYRHWALQDPRKAHVISAVNQSVARLFRKAKLNYPYDALKRDFQWLAEEVWSQLKDEAFNVDSVGFETLHKSIVEDLVQKWGGLRHVLVHLDMQTPQISTGIAASIKHHLSKKRSSICRFFRALAYDLTKPFRRLIVKKRNMSV